MATTDPRQPTRMDGLVFDVEKSEARDKAYQELKEFGEKIKQEVRKIK